ncbi:hypothetical protein BC831DRAFT_483855 [Entophlyctis helioformis]|nr:hypothetical protein BC831DRAFT_483855 [Entophlyctis helioformis]
MDLISALALAFLQQQQQQQQRHGPSRADASLPLAPTPFTNAACRFPCDARLPGVPVPHSLTAQQQCQQQEIHHRVVATRTDIHQRNVAAVLHEWTCGSNHVAMALPPHWRVHPHHASPPDSRPAAAFVVRSWQAGDCSHCIHASISCCAMH